MANKKTEIEKIIGRYEKKRNIIARELEYHQEFVEKLSHDKEEIEKLIEKLQKAK